MYVLSELGERLRLEKARIDMEMAYDALEEGIDGMDDGAVSPIYAQPGEEYDVLEDEIYYCEGTSQTTSGDEDTTNTTATTDLARSLSLEPTFYS